MRLLAAALCAAVCSGFAVPTQAVAEPAPAATLEQHVDEGLRHFRERRFAPARREFVAALGLVSDAESRSSLQFNIAACEYELGEYAAAERSFLELAEQDPAARHSALARAGLSALARSDREAARRHLARLSELELSGSAERTRLEAALAEADREQSAAASDSASAPATPADVPEAASRPALDAWARAGTPTPRSPACAMPPPRARPPAAARTAHSGSASHCRFGSA